MALIVGHRCHVFSFACRLCCRIQSRLLAKTDEGNGGWKDEREIEARRPRTTLSSLESSRGGIRGERNCVLPLSLGICSVTFFQNDLSSFGRMRLHAIRTSETLIALPSSLEFVPLHWGLPTSTLPHCNFVRFRTRNGRVQTRAGDTFVIESPADPIRS